MGTSCRLSLTLSLFCDLIVWYIEPLQGMHGLILYSKGAFFSLAFTKMASETRKIENKIMGKSIWNTFWYALVSMLANNKQRISLNVTHNMMFNKNEIFCRTRDVLSQQILETEWKTCVFKVKLLKWLYLNAQLDIGMECDCGCKRVHIEKK